MPLPTARDPFSATQIEDYYSLTDTLPVELVRAKPAHTSVPIQPNKSVQLMKTLLKTQKINISQVEETSEASRESHSVDEAASELENSEASDVLADNEAVLFWRKVVEICRNSNNSLSTDEFARKANEMEIVSFCPKLFMSLEKKRSKVSLEKFSKMYLQKRLKIDKSLLKKLKSHHNEASSTLSVDSMLSTKEVLAITKHTNTQETTQLYEGMQAHLELNLRKYDELLVFLSIFLYLRDKNSLDEAIKVMNRSSGRQASKKSKSKVCECNIL